MGKVRQLKGHAMKTRGEIWAGFAGMVGHGGWTTGLSANQADDMMDEYDMRFDADGDAKQQEGT